MSTHRFNCVVCGKETMCTADAHALGCGNGGCYDPGLKIEFCSIECALELQRRLVERIRIYREIVEARA